MNYEKINKSFLIISIFSLLIISFSLGLGWSLVKPYNARKIDFNSFHEYRTVKTINKIPYDNLLSYEKSKINYFDDTLRIQNIPFKLYQMICKDKPNDILQKYAEKWTNQKLLAIVNENEKGGNIESIDYINKRFMNVFVYYDDINKCSEIYATALSIDLNNYNNIKNILPSKSKGIEVSGNDKSLMPWSGNIKEEPYLLTDTIKNIVFKKKNNNIVQKTINYPFAWLILYDELNLKESSFLLKEIPEKRITLCIEIKNKLKL